jgi:hypothetical protein
MGSIQLLYITDTEMVKEISLCTSLSLGKPSFLSKDRGPLLGRGILSSSGPIWAHQRKTIAPELYIDKVKVNFCLFTMNKYIFHTHWKYYHYGISNKRNTSYYTLADHLTWLMGTN